MPNAGDLVEVDVGQVDRVVEVVAELGIDVFALIQAGLVDGVDHAAFRPALNAEHQEQVLVLIDGQPIVHAHDAAQLPLLHHYHLILLLQTWRLPEVALQDRPNLSDLPKVLEHRHVFIPEQMVEVHQEVLKLLLTSVLKLAEEGLEERVGAVNRVPTYQQSL